MKEINMFCYQCQETAGCTGCTVKGVCGKTPEVARIQDLLVYVTKGISEVTTKLRAEGKTISKEDNHLITLNLFTTITNANFDDEAITAKIVETLTCKEQLLKQLDDTSKLPEAAKWNGCVGEFAAKAASPEVGVRGRKISKRAYHLRTKGSFRIQQACKCSTQGQRRG